MTNAWPYFALAGLLVALGVSLVIWKRRQDGSKASQPPANMPPINMPPAGDTSDTSHSADADSAAPDSADADFTATDFPDLPEPRGQHYVFAHRALPGVARQDPTTTWENLSGPEAEEFLQALWEFVGREFTGDDRVRAEGLGCVVKRHRDCAIVVITLPQPVAVAEAYFTAFVFSSVTGSPVTGAKRRKQADWPFRYFTLELGFNLMARTERTVFAEWTARGHLNMGDGPAPTIDAFCARITELLA